MNWSDQGIVLSARKHGESSLIASIMTESHGSHMGLIRGGNSRRGRGVYEPGNFVAVKWQARLEDHLGAFTCELVEAKAALYLNNPWKLSCLSSACAVTEYALPEREPHPLFFGTFRDLLISLNTNYWMKFYILWELNLLAELGFGLELNVCAATGLKSQLAYVSPKSGQAVSKLAGKPYHDKLLPLPKFLTSDFDKSEEPSRLEILSGLELTGYFLNRYIFTHRPNEEPAARTRFIDRLKQLGTISSS